MSEENQPVALEEEVEVLGLDADEEVELVHLKCYGGEKTFALTVPELKYIGLLYTAICDDDGNVRDGETFPENKPFIVGDPKSAFDELDETKAIYEKDEDGNIKKDENGKDIVKEIVFTGKKIKMEGANAQFAVVPSDFNMQIIVDYIKHSISKKEGETPAPEPNNGSIFRDKTIQEVLGDDYQFFGRIMDAEGGAIEKISKLESLVMCLLVLDIVQMRKKCSACIASMFNNKTRPEIKACLRERGDLSDSEDESDSDSDEEKEE